MPDVPASRPLGPEAAIVLAVYGTLRRGERNAGLLAGATYLGTGLVLGQLVAMPRTADRAYPYPALVQGDDDVAVELYVLPDVELLARIDDLEAYDPEDEPGSEYVRGDVVVRDGPLDRAWVYRYNGPSAALDDPIRCGDWVGHRGCVDTG